MGLRLTRKPDQSWRDAAIEQARRFGMERDVTDSFDAYIAAGDDEAEAAWCSCHDWDVLDFVPDEPARSSEGEEG